MSGWVDSEQRRRTVERHSLEISEGLLSRFRPEQHLRDRSGEWTDMPKGHVSATLHKASPASGQRADLAHAARTVAQGPTTPAAPAKPQLSEMARNLATKIANLHGRFSGNTGLREKFAAGEMTEDDIRRLRAEAKDVVDATGPNRRNDPRASEQYDAAASVQALLRGLEKSLSGDIADRAAKREAPKYGSEEWLRRQQSVQRNALDPYGHYAWNTGG